MFVASCCAEIGSLNELALSFNFEKSVSNSLIAVLNRLTSSALFGSRSPKSFWTSFAFSWSFVKSVVSWSTPVPLRPESPILESAVWILSVISSNRSPNDPIADCSALYSATALLASAIFVATESHCADSLFPVANLSISFNAVCNSLIAFFSFSAPALSPIEAYAVLRFFT